MKKLITIGLLFCSLAAFSQEKEKKDTYLPKGNKEFKKKESKEAEASYRISQSNTPAKAAAAYNLGNAIYRQGEPGESKFAYLKAIEHAETKEQKHKAYHNLGNALMEEKNYQSAVGAYRNALRNNPYDDETRYNFALAKKMLKENPPKPQNQQNKDKGDQKNQDKNQSPKDNEGDKPKDNQGDKQDKEQGGDDKDKGGKDKKDKQDDNGQQKPYKGNAGQDKQPADASPSKQRMENLLDAMNNEERKVQDRINAKKAKGQPQRQEKDW